MSQESSYYASVTRREMFGKTLTRAIYAAVVMAMALLFASSAGPKESGDISLIPYPLHMRIGDAFLELPSRISVLSGKPLSNEATHLIEALHAMGIQTTTLEVENLISIHLQLDKALDSLGTEGYTLRIGAEGIDIRGYTPGGVFYGIQSLLQLIPGAFPKQLPYLEIVDKPRFSYRGLHLDVCRHFFPVDFIKRYLDQMARYKLNTFHWHLTEDQGWRIEIKQYPLLTHIGSKRVETMVEKHFKPYLGDGIPYEGYYTQEQVREIVAYAAKRHIQVIPEIEMPGHSLAALAAYPAYSCMGGPFTVATTWGVFEDVFCTREETFEFLGNILKEVCQLFPGQYIHIGGDEAPKARWQACPVCQQRMAEEGLKDEHELQSYFIRRIEKILDSQGKKLIGWDEILEGGLPPTATVMSWRGEEGGISAAKQGHDVIMTPGFAMYFDHYQGDPATEPLAICCHTPIRKVYNYDPIPLSLTAREKQHILGVQANVWTEYMKTPEHVEYMVNPRLMALAEIAWIQPEHKDYGAFMQRLPWHLRRMDLLGIHYRKPEATDAP